MMAIDENENENEFENPDSEEQKYDFGELYLKSIVCGLMTNQEFLQSASGKIKPACITDFVMRKIVKTILAHHEATGTIPTIPELCQAIPKIEQVGEILERCKATEFNAGNVQGYLDSLDQFNVRFAVGSLASDLKDCWDNWKPGRLESVLKRLETFGDGQKKQPVKESDYLLWDEAKLLPPPQWLIDDWLYQDSLAFLAGDSKVGKSFLAIDMALSVACGIPFQGKPTKKQSVVYIAGEGASGLVKRGLIWESFNPQPIGANFMLVRKSKILNDPSDCNEIIREAFNRLGEMPGLIVVDTLFRCLRGSDNDPQAIGEFLHGCDKLREGANGACVLVVAHTGKDKSKGIRGHSGLRGNAETVLLADREEGSMRLEITVDKMKDDEDGQVINFLMQKHVVGDVVSLVLVPDSEYQIANKDLPLLKRLQGKFGCNVNFDRGGITQEVICSELNISMATYYRSFKSLIEAGAIGEINATTFFLK